MESSARSEVAPSSKRRWISWALAGLLAISVSWTYRAASRFEYFSYDDLRYLESNPKLAPGLSWEGLSWAATANFASLEPQAEYWMPVTLLTRLADRQWWGTDPGGAHAQNVAWHALNAVLVFLLLRAATASTGRSAAAAMIFALHPVQAETVCWLAARKDLLAGTGCLLTAMAHVRFVRAPSWGRYALVLGAFALALMAKPSVVSFPLALLVMDWWPLRRWKWPDGLGRLVRLAVEKLPLLLLAAITAAVSYVGQDEVGGTASEVPRSLAERLGEGAIGYVRYLRSLFWPEGLTIYPVSDLLTDWRIVAGAVALLLALTLAFVLLARRNVCAPLAGWIWFIGVLAPLSGVVSFGRQSIADRYLYLVMPGIAAAIIWGASAALSALPRVPVRAKRWIGATAAVGIAVALSAATTVQAATWRNSLSIWGHCLRWEPGNPMAWVGYGVALREIGDPDKLSSFCVNMGARLRPDSPDFLSMAASSLMLENRYEQAVRKLERLVRMDPIVMRHHQFLAYALEKTGNARAAERAMGRAGAVRARVLMDFAYRSMNDGDGQAMMENLRGAADAKAEADASVRRDAPVSPAPAWATLMDAGLAASASGQRALTGMTAGELPLAQSLACVLSNRAEEAVPFLVDAARLRPKDPEPRWRVAALHYIAGQTAEAEQWKAQAEALGGDEKKRLRRIWDLAKRRLEPETAPPLPVPKPELDKPGLPLRP